MNFPDANELELDDLIDAAMRDPESIGDDMIDSLLECDLLDYDPRI